MFVPRLRDFRFEPADGNVACRAGGQDARQRCAVDRVGRGEGRAGCREDGAALFHIVDDVGQIGERQHAAPLVAVEDDEVELVELFGKEFARREGDQRQFADGRRILLFRRAQNGEMHEIDRGVGLQQVAPCPLARMRFARDQQNAQAVANAVGDHHGAIVQHRQLFGARGDIDLDDVGAAMAERQGDGRGLADRGIGGGHLLAIDRNRHRRDPFRFRTCLVDTE